MLTQCDKKSHDWYNDVVVMYIKECLDYIENSVEWKNYYNYSMYNNQVIKYN